MARASTFMGGYLEYGGWPKANSSAVIPKDQMSALWSSAMAREENRTNPHENKVAKPEVPKAK
jgi:hypothetical protein